MTSPIDYATPAPWFRHRYFRRALIILPLLIVGILAYCFGPAIYHRIEVLGWQRRCMDHIDPPAVETKTLADPPADLDKLWSEFPALMHPPFANVADRRHAVFLHRLTSPAGDRLVYVYEDYLEIGWFDATNFSTQVIRPATLLSDPEKLNTQNRLLSEELSKQLYRSQTTIHPGQPDPADPAAFTIDMETGGTIHTARFRLAAAGDQIEFVSLAPPLP